MDVCALSRPFDDQSYMRIRLEADAVYLILDKVQKGKYELITSSVHLREIGDNDNFEEKLQLLSLLQRFSKRTNYDIGEAKMRAEGLISKGFGVADAAHLAFAEQAADTFISCDDKLLRKCKTTDLAVKVMNPIKFCDEERLR